jgi:hypothetical protein
MNIASQLELTFFVAAGVLKMQPGLVAVGSHPGSDSGCSLWANCSKAVPRRWKILGVMNLVVLFFSG